MKRFKVTISNPAGGEYSYYWDTDQVHLFTQMPSFDLEQIIFMHVKNSDGSGYIVEEDK